MDPHASHLLSLLREGREYSRSRNVLAMSLGISDRTLRQLVEELRRDGVLIGSTNEAPGGYYICANVAELEATAAHLKARALSTLATMSAMRRGAIIRFGAEQGALFDLEDVAV